MRWHDFQDLSPLPSTFFHQPRRVHFIGIGGIGMSALALALAERGHHVSGSDAGESATLQTLRDAKIKTCVGHDAQNLRVLGDTAEAIIFSSAIPSHNSERAAARESGVPEWHRAQLLADFANNAKVSIAVSGTHGKSTTSAMIAHILERCGLNPTALLGAVYPPFNSNARLGDRDLVVVEADESDGSFTLLHPTISVITNVEAEHLENYKNSEDELWRAFSQFAAQTSGARVLNADDAHLLHKLGDEKTVRYSLQNAQNVRAENRKLHYTLHDAEYSLMVPGQHNLSNALAAIAAAEQLGIAPDEAARAMESFAGVKRRFQFIGEAQDILFYDDYGHHPTEVLSTLRTARDFLGRPVLAVFQPHRFSRTQQMGHLFGPAFEAADTVIITQLYSAHEEPIAGISGRIVLESAQAAFPQKPIFYAENLEEARALVKQHARPGDAVMCLGAGDITTLPPQLLRDFSNIETVS